MIWPWHDLLVRDVVATGAVRGPVRRGHSMGALLAALAMLTVCVASSCGGAGSGPQVASSSSVGTEEAQRGDSAAVAEIRAAAKTRAVASLTTTGPAGTWAGPCSGCGRITEDYIAPDRFRYRIPGDGSVFDQIQVGGSLWTSKERSTFQASDAAVRVEDAQHVMLAPLDDLLGSRSATRNGDTYSVVDANGGSEQARLADGYVVWWQGPGGTITEITYANFNQVPPIDPPAGG